MIEPLRFIYKAVDQDPAAFIVENWHEEGVYIKGYCRNLGPRTFRKDRVIEYLDSCALLLKDPHTPPPKKLNKHEPTGPEIVFTGFPAVQKALLQKKAVEHGMVVRQNVTQGLDYLCGGPTAGQAKVQKAKLQNVIICDQAQLFLLWETGELPDEPPEFL